MRGVVWTDVLQCVIVLAALIATVVKVGTFECILNGVTPHKNKYTYAYIYTYFHTYMHTYIHRYIHTYMHTYTHTYIHKYIHTLE